MRYFVIALSIACLDLGKEENEENENDNISENVNSRLVSMSASFNHYDTWEDQSMYSRDCTFIFINDPDALDIDCEICDSYGFMVFSEMIGECTNPDPDLAESEEDMNNSFINMYSGGFGINSETNKVFSNSGTAWLEHLDLDAPGTGSCEYTESSINCSYSYESTAWDIVHIAGWNWELEWE